MPWKHWPFEMEANVKPKHSYPGYDGTPKEILEHRLRSAICAGDMDDIREMIDVGVDVNCRDPVEGWTPLHYACRDKFMEAVEFLLVNNADYTIRSNTGEMPISVCVDEKIIELLNDVAEGRRPYNSLKDELVLKIRIANTPDPDFVEIELPQTDLTYESLLRVCCKELSLSPTNILKLRKLPNTKLRKDKDIQRLQSFEEIEVVLDSAATYKYTQNSNGVQTTIPTSSKNGYQSMSEKDQVILY